MECDAILVRWNECESIKVWKQVDRVLTFS